QGSSRTGLASFRRLAREQAEVQPRLLYGSETGHWGRWDRGKAHWAPVPTPINQMEGESSMNKTSIALGLLGLVYAVVLPAASAKTLWQPDVSKGTLDPPAGSTLYTQGVNTATLGADSTTKDNPGIKPFVVITDKVKADDIFDNSCSCLKSKGWLDNGDS